MTGTQPDDLPIAISWNAPDECPGIDELKAEVRRVAGQVPPPSERLSAEATVKRGPGTGWLLTLATKAGERAGERRLAGTDCAELMHAAALVLALMINPQASFVRRRRRRRPRRRRPRRRHRSNPSGASPPAPTSSSATARCRASRPGIGLRFAAGGAALSAELRASLWASRSTASTSDPNAGGSFYLADGAVAGCARARRDRRLSPGACVGASLVRLHGTGYGVTDPGDDVRLVDRRVRGGEPAPPAHARRTRCGWRRRPWFRWETPISSLAGWVMYSNRRQFGYVGSLGWELHF